MGSPRKETNGATTAAGDEARTNSPTPFLSKTYRLVDDDSTDGIISWSRDGSSFIVWDPTEFAKTLLPKLFKHDNFSSFIRQLNTYQFRKVVPDRWEFSNENFRKGKKHLLCKIFRRKSGTTGSKAPPISSEEEEEEGEGNANSSISSSGNNNNNNNNWEVIEENERLRNENKKLRRELSEMKRVFQIILDQTSKYANLQLQLPENSFPAPMQLDLPGWRDDDEESIGTKLFGVCIGAKRRKIISGGGGENREEVYGCPPELQVGR